ncbi:MAG: acetyl-CoA carboxylase biotin carboxyl carrier protein [Balneolaceae bacterium]
MDLKQIKKILDLISESEVNEVSIEEGDFKIKVKKTGTVEQVTYSQPLPPAPVAQPAAPASTAAPAQETTAAPAASGETVKSPIVGTFYEAASPDSDPFIKVGDKVKKGQTLCIIEAMKIMNEIESEFSGTVKEIIISDATPVEFDQPLFIIQKD